MTGEDDEVGIEEMFFPACFKTPEFPHIYVFVCMCVHVFVCALSLLVSDQENLSF